MSQREIHSILLDNAISSLNILGTDSSDPYTILTNAIKESTYVWNDSSTYMQGPVRTQLRIAVISLKGVAQASARQEFLKTADMVEIAKVKAILQQTKAALFKKPRVAISNYSYTGKRFAEISDITLKPAIIVDANLHQTKEQGIFNSNNDVTYNYENETRMKDALDKVQQYKQKLKSKVGPEGFIVNKMPIMATLKRVDIKRLNATGIEYKLLSGGFLFKNHLVMNNPTLRDMPSILFLDQIVVGVPNNILKDAEELKNIMERVIQRMGKHINPLKSKDGMNLTIRSPGNPLAWIWLIPESVMSSRSFVILKASFPWQGNANPAFQNKENKQDKKELEHLVQEQDILLKLGKHLNPMDLTRISELQEKLDIKPESNEEKKKRLTVLKEELQKRLLKRFPKEFIEIKLLKEEIDDLSGRSDSKAKTRMAVLKKEIQSIEKIIEKAKPAIVEDLKQKYNK
jgi:hypothetical protein